MHTYLNKGNYIIMGGFAALRIAQIGTAETGRIQYGVV